jgi:cytochrome P450
VADLEARMPMRVIGMLLGIPEQDQETIRQQANTRLHREPGKPARFAAGRFADETFFGEYLDWRVQHPSDDLMTELVRAEFEDETGTVRRLNREEILTYVNLLASAGNETKINISSRVRCRTVPVSSSNSAWRRSVIRSLEG